MGVGMSLEPSDPGSDYCHVSCMQDGGALANDGRVKPGDKLVRVDGFDCIGVPRAVIRSRVLGPPHSEVVLEFQRDRRMFKVILLRTPGLAATHSVSALLDVSKGAPAKLMSSSVRNSVSGSATSQAENRDREQGLERRAHKGACARSQAAERFQGSLSDKERGNGNRTKDAEWRDGDREQRGWWRGRDTKRQKMDELSAQKWTSCQR